MEIFRSDEQLFSWLDGVKDAARCVTGALEREFGLVMSYYEGQGWTSIDGSTNRLEQLRIDRNPDSVGFRVGLNRTSKLVQRVAVSTEPSNIEVDVLPPDRDAGVDAAVKAQVYEDAVNESIGLSGFLNAWCNANFTRSVCGTAGIGWCLIPKVTPMNDGETTYSASDVQLEAFSFLPIKLTLDPRVEERDLHRHEYVVYSDAWSVGKIERIYGETLKKLGIRLDPDTMKTFGELCVFEDTLNVVTNNRLFSRYRSESRTRAAMVHQVHRKSGSGYGRFDRYDVILELPDRRIRLTEKEQDSPFGGSGMPLSLLHAHRRPDSIWSIGDCKMLVDDQDRLNRTQLYLERQLIHNTRKQWKVDKRTMGLFKTPDQIRKAFTSAEAGIILYESGTGTDKGNPPELVTPPPPQSFLLQHLQTLQGEMREQIHRADGHFGNVKTHVPDATFQRAIDESGQVLDMRVAEDKRTMAQQLTDMLGTVCKLCAEQSPAMLGLLSERGFTADELLILADTDHTLPPCTVRVRDSSIRLRSYASRKQDLDTAAQLQMVDASTYRREMAGMDTPLAAEDKLYRTAFDRFARDVLFGAEWTPIPLGDRTNDLLDSFRRAMLDRRADEAARARLTIAVQSQQLMFQQEMLTAQPQALAAPQQAQAEDPTEASFSSLVDQISSQVAGPQPVAA